MRPKDKKDGVVYEFFLLYLSFVLRLRRHGIFLCSLSLSHGYLGLPLGLRFVRPHRFELRRKGVRRRILRLLCNSACVRIIADPLTVSAFSSLAWRHCRIART